MSCIVALKVLHIYMAIASFQFCIGWFVLVIYVNCESVNDGWGGLPSLWSSRDINGSFSKRSSLLLGTHCNTCWYGTNLDWMEDQQKPIRPCGLMDKAPDFGSGDCRFESCHGRSFLFLTHNREELLSEYHWMGLLLHRPKFKILRQSVCNGDMWHTEILNQALTKYHLPFLSKYFDRDRTRTCNPQIRSLVPYPLGHTV